MTATLDASPSIPAPAVVRITQERASEICLEALRIQCHYSTLLRGFGGSPKAWYKMVAEKIGEDRHLIEQFHREIAPISLLARIYPRQQLDPLETKNEMLGKYRRIAYKIVLSHIHASQTDMADSVRWLVDHKIKAERWELVSLIIHHVLPHQVEKLTEAEA